MIFQHLNFHETQLVNLTSYSLNTIFRWCRKRWQIYSRHVHL